MNKKAKTSGPEGAAVETAEGVRLRIHAQPGAKTTMLSGWHGDALKIRVHAPPVDGKANDELIRFLADHFSISRNQVRVVQGELSRQKTILVVGLRLHEVLVRLNL